MSTSGPDLSSEPPQRWYVAVLYADLSRSTEYAVNMEAELYGEILDSLRQVYQQVVAAHGGSLLQVHGDGMLAMFGFPAAGEQDVRLALNAALELHARVRALRPQIPEVADLPLRLRLHTGVHAGVAVVQTGDIYRGTYQLRGDITNVCARLSGLAAEDEILVSAASLGGNGAFFKCGEPRQLTLKGIADPMTVVPVLDRSALKTRYQARRARSRLPFIGRTRELNELRSSWREVRRGSSAVISVVGEPGVGKTRLVDEFLGSLADLPAVFRGQCETLAQARPLEAFLSMDDLFGDAAPPVGVEGTAAQETLFQAVFETLRKRSGHGPVILFIDDWHWADDMTRRLVAQLAVTLRRLLVVLTSRPLPAARTQFLQSHRALQLGGLAWDDVKIAMDTLVPHAAPLVADQIKSLAGGNPLYLEALCQLTALDQVDHAPSEVANVPQWLYSVVQTKVLQLESRDRKLVYAAAVIGDNVPLWLWRQVAGFDGAETLTGLAFADLMYPVVGGGDWHFKHGLTREIIYHLIGLRERQDLHRQVAKALRGQPDTSERIQALANHYYGAGDFAQAARYAHSAADSALAAPALDIARVQYHRTLECLDRGMVSDEAYREMVRVTKRLSYVALLDPAKQELPVIERTRQLAVERDDAATRALTNFWLGNVHYGLGESRRALRYQHRARLEAERLHDTKLIVEVARSLAQATAASCHHEEAKDLLRGAVAVGRDSVLTSAEKASTAYSLGCLGMVLGDQGYFADAHRAFENAFEWVGRGHVIEANVLAKAVAVRIWQGDWQAAVTSAERVITLSEDIRNAYLLGMARVLQGYAMFRINGESDHIERMRETTHWLEQCGNGQFLSLNYGWLALVSLESGDFESVRRYGARAFARARQGDGFGLASAARALSLAAALQGWPRSGPHYLAIADASAAQRASPREAALNNWFRVQLAELARDKTQATHLRALVETSFRELKMDWHSSALRRAGTS